MCSCLFVAQGENCENAYRCACIDRYFRVTCNVDLKGPASEMINE